MSRKDYLITAYSLVRQDLVAGGYRRDDVAYFPMTDVQGSIRDYTNTSGLQSAYGLAEINYTSQATRWTGMSYTNNPGILYRRMNGITPFYTSSTWQGYHLW